MPPLRDFRIEFNFGKKLVIIVIYILNIDRINYLNLQLNDKLQSERGFPGGSVIKNPPACRTWGLPCIGKIP